MPLLPLPLSLSLPSLKPLSHPPFGQLHCHCHRGLTQLLHHSPFKRSRRVQSLVEENHLREGRRGGTGTGGEGRSHLQSHNRGDGRIAYLQCVCVREGIEGAKPWCNGVGRRSRVGTGGDGSVASLLLGPGRSYELCEARAPSRRRDEPQLSLRQPEACRGPSHPNVARQRPLEPTSHSRTCIGQSLL